MTSLHPKYIFSLHFPHLKAFYKEDSEIPWKGRYKVGFPPANIIYSLALYTGQMSHVIYGPSSIWPAERKCLQL